MDPNNNLIWKYNLTRSRLAGLYSLDELNKYRDTVLTQSRIDSISNNLISDISSPNGDYSLTRGFSVADFEKIKVETTSGFLNWLTRKAKIIGDVTSFGLGVFMIFKFFQYFVGVFLNVKLLYDIFGLSWRLLASISEVVSSFCVHRKNLQDMKTQKEAKSAGPELKSMSKEGIDQNRDAITESGQPATFNRTVGDNSGKEENVAKSLLLSNIRSLYPKIQKPAAPEEE